MGLVLTSKSGISDENSSNGYGLTFMRKLTTLAVALALAIPGPAISEGLFSSGSSSSRSAIFGSQKRLLDGRLSKQYKGSVKLRPNGTISTSASTRIPAYNGSYKGTYLPVAKAMARKHGIPENLFLRLVQQESAWKPKARSHKGAIGLAQLMPGTARKLGVNPHDPQQNLEGGARYLKRMYNKFGSWRLALAAYNAGPGAVEKYNGIPPYKETKNYVRKILGSYS